MFSSKFLQPPKRNFAFVILLFFVSGWLTQSTAARAVAAGSNFDAAPGPASVSFPVGAQLSQVTFGQTIEGTLDQTDQTLYGGSFFDEYTFAGVEGQDILINLASSDFDAFLWLLDGGGELLEFDDDTGEGIGALISGFVLPQNGTYTLLVSSYEVGETGAYRLALNEAPSLDPQTSLAMGTEIEGELSAANLRFDTGQFYETYTFEAVHGQAAAIEMHSEQFDPYLWLLDPAGQLITVGSSVRPDQDEKQDESPPTPGSQFIYLPSILDFALSDKDNDQTDRSVLGDQATTPEGGSTSRIIFFPPVSGSYTLLASSEAATQGGGYRLVVHPGPAPTEAEPLAGPVSGRLARADVQLNAGQYVDVYSFQGEAGRRMTLTLEAANFDSYLRVLDGQGHIVAENDDSGGQSNALIDDLTLPAAGLYYIWVSSVFSGEVGDYTLTLSEGSLTSTGRLALSEPEEGVEFVFSKKGGRVEPGGIGASGKGQPLAKAATCAGTILKYTAKVKISSGSRHITDQQLEMYITPSQGTKMNWPTTPVTLKPQQIQILSPIELTLWGGADPGTRTVTAYLPTLGSDQEDMYVIGLTSDTVATAAANADDARTRIGIGEEVVLSLTPDIPAAWSVVSGGGSVSPNVGGTTTFTAEKDQAPPNATVQASFEGATCQIKFELLSPKKLNCAFDQNKSLGTLGPPNNQIGARATFDCTVAPTIVSFYNVRFREDGQAATWTWPDGTQASLSRNRNFRSPDFDNVYRKNISSGLDPIDRIHNGTKFQDFNYSVQVYEQYKNDAGQWVRFKSYQQIREYRGATQKARIKIQADNEESSDWIGPWQ